MASTITAALSSLEALSITRHFKIPIGLALDRSDRVGDIPRVVPIDDDDRDAGFPDEVWHSRS